MLKILNGFIPLFKEYLFPIYVQMFLFPKLTFHFKDTLWYSYFLTSVVQKFLILMELRDRYLTLAQHTLLTIWRLV